MVGTSNQLVPVAWPLIYRDFRKWGGTHDTRWMVKIMEHSKITWARNGLPSGND